MFVDVIVKHKDSAERNVATIGKDSDYLHDVAGRFQYDSNLEYIKLTLSTYWRNKQEENNEVQSNSGSLRR